MTAALTEEEIHRYSRQILLGAVGGEGQRALLRTCARVRGTSQALMTAAAYLAAGGTPLKWIETHPSGGFWVGVATDASAGSQSSAGEPCLSEGLLGEGGAVFAGSAPWVALGSRGGVGAVVFRGEEGCLPCFAARVSELGPPAEGAPATALGALAALLFQRLLVQRGPALGVVQQDALGGFATVSGAPCEHSR